MMDEKIIEKLTENTNVLVRRSMAAMSPEKLSDSRYAYVSTVNIEGMLDYYHMLSCSTIMIENLR